MGRAEGSSMLSLGQDIAIKYVIFFFNFTIGIANGMSGCYLININII